ncbi:MAG: Ig-like domain-containing protein, partial [Candidatus Kerfeldbacteria bacterium]|nr:Ig-like domain-containing protein [Candidatus Kerfeldbacteria bacterium]
DLKSNSQLTFTRVGGAVEVDSKYIKSWRNQNIVAAVPDKDYIQLCGQPLAPCAIKIKTGDVKVIVTFPVFPVNYGGTQTSNPVTFTVDPYITSITPAQGPAGSWLTIKGGNFGECTTRGNTLTAPCVVTFASSGAARVFELALPLLCSNAWTDSEIITKAPANGQTGLVKVVNEQGYETKDSASKTFTYDSKLPIAPGLCKLDPASTANLPQAVELYGDNFGAVPDSNSGVQFSNIEFTPTSSPTWSQWNMKTITLTAPKEPKKTVSGEVYVKREQKIQTSTKCNGIVVGGKCLGTEEPVYKTEITVSNPMEFKISDKPKVENVVPQANQTNVCRNSLITITFDRFLGGESPLAVDEFKVSQVCGGAALTCNSAAVPGSLRVAGKELSFAPAAPLEPNATYRVQLNNNNIVCGVFCDWQFKTQDKICEISKVGVEPAQYTFTKTGTEGEREFSAKAVSNDGQELVANYLWDKSDKNNIFSYTISSLTKVKAQAVNKNGSAVLVVKAENACDFPQGCSKPGVANKCPTGYIWFDRNNNKQINDNECIKSQYIKSTDIPIEVFICDFPWVFNDAEENISLKYCRGNLTDVKVGQTQLLKNPDFENALQDWSSTSQWQVAAFKQQGANSAANTTGAGELLQTVNVTPGYDYLLTGYIYYSGAVKIGLGSNEQAFSGSPGVWQKITILTKAVTGNLTLKFTAQAGSVYVDNLDLREASGLLPGLSQPAPPYVRNQGDLLREYFFRVNDSSDVFGLRVYKNFARLSPLDWYNSRTDINRGSPKKIKDIDGYETIQDGNAYYVSAVKQTGTTLYTNMYVLSFNQGARPDTSQLAAKLLAGWQFNTNISEPAKLAGLKRDIKRVQDLELLKKLVRAYQAAHDSYPPLSAGTFEVGQTTSVWPSWQATLGNDLAKALPTDPLNNFADLEGNDLCRGAGYEGYDPTTCWNSSIKDFKCPAGSHIYQYQAGVNTTLSLNFEYKGVIWPGTGTEDINTGLSTNNSCQSFKYNFANHNPN